MRWNIAILPVAMTLAGCVGVETMPEPRGSGRPAAHPLDPLTAGEIDAAVAILKTAGKLPEGAFFAILVLRQDPRPHYRDGGDGRSGRGRSIRKTRLTTTSRLCSCWQSEPRCLSRSRPLAT